MRRFKRVSTSNDYTVPFAIKARRMRCLGDSAEESSRGKLLVHINNFVQGRAVAGKAFLTGRVVFSDDVLVDTTADGRIFSYVDSCIVYEGWVNPLSASPHNPEENTAFLEDLAAEIAEHLHEARVEIVYGNAMWTLEATREPETALT